MVAFPFRAGLACMVLVFAALSDASLIVDYDFAGNATDASGMHNDGVVHGNPGFSGSAITFNNPFEGPATQWVSIPNSTSVLNLTTSSFTFGILFRSFDTTQHNGRLFGGGWGEPQIVFDYNATGVPHAYWQVQDDLGQSVSTRDGLFGNPQANMTDGEWRWAFGVLDRDAKQMRQYVGGVKIAEVSFATLDAIHFPGLDIGRVLHQETSAAMMTSMDRFLLFDEALTDERIQDIVNPVPEPTTALVLVGLSVAVTRRRRR